MKIYLVRHGESTPAGTDDERPLSEKGKQDIKNLAKLLSPLHIQLMTLFHSKKLRAQQTAKILSSVMNIQNEPQARLELDPIAPIFPIMNDISQAKGDIMLVGHMPFMGKLASQLIVGKEEKEVVMFNAGSILCLEKIEENLWIIRWMLSPELV